MPTEKSANQEQKQQVALSGALSLSALLFVHALWLGLGFLFLYLFDLKVLLHGYLIGGGVSLLNSVGLVYAWPRILSKKSVALPLAVVVSKFALSVGIIYWVVRHSTGSVDTSSGLTMIGLFFGLLTVLPATISIVLWGQLRPQEQIEKRSEIAHQSGDH